jgi:large repetitive protein
MQGHFYKVIRLLILLIVCSLSQQLVAQIQVTNINAGNVLAQKLVGPGVSVTNSVLTCNPNQSGLFIATTSNLGIDSGIVLTTGNASTIGLINGVNGAQTMFANANQGGLGDADLDVLAGTSTHDRCILEFDFKADGDSVEFQYVFGSEEYPAFNCNVYNDVFGFFISGPGYTTPKNIALIPNTTIPVAINSVNDGSVLSGNGGNISNCVSMGAGSPFTNYYNNNALGTSLTYDGFTALFTSKAAIQQCQIYHLKLAIADGFDHIFDSGVFLKAGSLTSNSVKLEVQADSLIAGIPFLYEGCDSAKIKIKRNLIQSIANTDSVQLIISGTATNGIDYPTITSTYVFANSLSDSVKLFSIKPINDFITEGVETIKIILVDRCGTYVDSTKIQINDPPNFLLLNNDTTICAGSSVPTQGTYDADLIFNWQPTTGVTNPTQFNAVFAPATTTTYTLTASHNGCNAVIDSFKIIVQPLPTLSTTSTNLPCFAQNVGAIIANATSSSNPMSIKLLPLNLTQTTSPANFNNLQVGIYTVTVTSGLGCTKTASVTIIEPPQMIWSTNSILNISCSAASNGQITAVATGGTGQKNYTLTPNNISNTTGMFSALAGGNYSVTVADANGCSLITSTPIIQISNLNWVSTTSVNLPCYNQTNGSIAVNAVGGSGLISYKLLPNNIINNSGAFATLSAGVYTVQANDATTCTATTIFNITQPSLLTNSTTTSSPLCNGLATGSVQANAIGGTSSLSFVLNPGAVTNTTGSYPNLVAGIYTVTTIDGNGCSVTTTATIAQPNAIVFSSVTKISPTCTTPISGSLIANVTGGVGTLSYALNTGLFQSSNTFSGLIVGIYTITTKDANNCTKSTTVTLNSSNSPILINSTLPILCNTLTTNLNVTASGGTPIYHYTLLPGSVTNTTGSFGSAVAGTYTVNVSDANGCTASIVIVIQPPLPIVWQSFIINKTPCNSTTGGSISVTAGNGTPVYTYQIQPSGANNTNGIFTNLNNGTYTVVATDANNCTVSSIFNMTSLLQISIASPTITSPACYNTNTGAIAVSTSGGSGTKTFTINPSAIANTTGTFTNLSSGIYTISVADAFNCSNVTTITISQPANIVINTPTLVLPSCNPGGNGVITMNATGGTGTLQYKINNSAFQNSTIFSGLNIGTYTVMVKDANSCTKVSTVGLVNPTAMSFANLTVNQAFCIGSPTGSIQANVMNATGIVNFSIFPGAISNTSGNFTNLPINTYTISAVDANGCNITATASVIVPSNMAWTSTTATNITCHNANNGIIQVAANGGNGAMSYTIQPFNVISSTGVFNSLIANVYTVTAADVNGCTKTTTLNITNPFALQWSNPTSSNVICNGTPTGSITSLSVGGTGLLDYTLTPSSITNNTGNFPALSNNIYTVTVNDANACTNTISFTINQNTAFAISGVATTMPTCVPGNNGVIVTSALGGLPPYQYQLNGGMTQTSNTFNNLGVSTYTISVKDAVGCIKTSSVVLTNPASPSITNTTIVNPPCYGTLVGSILTTASGGSGALTYKLLPNNIVNATGIYNSLAASNYTVNVTDANGCSATSNVVLTQPNLLMWDSVNNRNISCFGGSNGLVTSSASGGSGSITYTLQPSNIVNSSGAFLGLIVGTYTLTAVDSNGCTIYSTFSINQAPPLVWNTTLATSPTCVGLSNGSINAIVTGGVGLKNYNLMPSNVTNTTGIFSNLASGTYTITSKDANSCSLTTILTVSPPLPVLFSNAITTFASCNPGCDATANVIGSGGTGTFSYSKNSGITYQNVNSFSALCTGVYTITIKDGNNCTGTGSFNISTATGPNVISSQSILPSCFGNTNGSITIVALGGTGIVNYTLNPSSLINTTGLFSSLSIGNYSITASDANGCTISTITNLTQPNALQLGIPIVTNATCANGTNGAFTISTTGGTGVISYTLQPSNTQNNTGIFTTLSANTYTITATDFNNCSSSATITIGQPAAMSVIADSSFATSCFGGSDGELFTSVVGGNGVINFTLLPSNVTNTNGSFFNLSATSYTVISTDANGCTGSINMLIQQPSALQITQVLATSPSCVPGNDAMLTITAIGATPSYLYSVNGGVFQSSNIISNLSAGTFTITAKDAKSCLKTATQTIVNTTLPVFTNLITTQASCNPGCDAVIVAVSNNGVGVPQYSIDQVNYQYGSSFPNLCGATTYTITVKDAIGCTNTSSASITTVVSPTLSSVILTNVSCNSTLGLGNGAIQINAAGGTLPITYDLQPNNVQNITGLFSSLGANTYSIIGTDANGCTISTSINITQPTAINFSVASISEITCFGGNNGAVQTTISGGAGLYNYAIAPSGNVLLPNNFNNLVGNTTYTITAVDANGCTITTNATLSSPSLIQIDSISTTPVTCNGDNNGTLFIVASGGTGILNYTLQPTNQTNTNGVYDSLSGNNYTVTITDANSCTISTSTLLYEPPVLNFLTITSTMPTCYGSATGIINITSTGGNPGTIEYELMFLNQINTTGVFSNLAAGAYGVIIRDTNGCNSSTFCSIQQPWLLFVNSMIVNNVKCNNGNDGSIFTTAMGGTGLLTYQLLPNNISNTTGSFFGLTPNTYTLHITDINNCSLDTTFTITQPLPLNLTLDTIKNVTCYEANDGMIGATAFGGTLPYLFDLQPGFNSSLGYYPNLAAGIYVMMVSDSNGCTDTLTNLVITQPTLLQLTSVAHTNVTCYASTSGTINVTAVGGSGILTYVLQPNNIQNVTGAFSNLSSNIYTITVIDANNCSITTIVNVTNFLVIDPTWILTQPNCNGDANGSMSVSALGGTAPLSFSVNNGAFTTNAVFNNLKAGTYLLIIKDAFGCSKDTFVVLPQPDKVNAIVYLENQKCINTDDGLIQASGYGGQGDFTYYLNPGTKINKSGFFDKLAVGQYSLTIKDKGLCVFDTLLVIEPPLNPLGVTLSKQDLDCLGIGIEGWANASPVGGKAPYSFTWSNAQTTPKIINLAAGFYTITIRDSDNCIINGQVEIASGKCCAEVFAPDAFSPNGDHHNDVWRLTTSAGLRILQFEIYNRWGNKVWFTSDQHATWNGVYNGKQLGVDTYFYILRYICENDGLRYMKKGDITLIR